MVNVLGRSALLAAILFVLYWSAPPLWTPKKEVTGRAPSTYPYTKIDDNGNPAPMRKHDPYPSDQSSKHYKAEEAR